ncbi:hypothetical protein WJX72_008102 [[Myrmecia] bisecta]|uniref:Endoglucanase n=1 Tax=[Myrmecia] bisecta TaxID=41462 RepID=A0AAW1PGR3_9CHLO
MTGGPVHAATSNTPSNLLGSSGHTTDMCAQHADEGQSTSPAQVFNQAFSNSTALPILDGRALTSAELANGSSPIVQRILARNAAATKPITPQRFAAPANYDWATLLDNAYFFYEAQKSGKLPANNRVDWRGDSALGDSDGYDLVGGHYDAGDHLKLMFPMGYTFTTLAYGLLEFEQGYQAAGVYDTALATLKWATDFLVKCHVSPFQFVAQVGDTNLDHSYWGRPEDMTMARPSYIIDASKPSSDMLGGIAGALAASSMVFRTTNPSYAALLLSEARSLYSWGTSAEGKYSSYGISQLYPSSTFLDDLTTAAAWLYVATGEAPFLTQARQYWARSLAEEGSRYYKVSGWDNQFWTAATLMSKLVTTDSQYATYIESFLQSYVDGTDGVIITPKGLRYTGDYGSLRNALGAAFLAQVYSKYIAAAQPLKALTYQCMAQSQLRYAAGDTGHSYIVGFGVNPPSREHHRSSSCPFPANGPCSFDATYYSPAPNAHVLYGGLVGGPLRDDSWTDDRTNYVQNEVALDYNAGFTGTVASMLQPGNPSWDTCSCVLSQGAANSTPAGTSGPGSELQPYVQCGGISNCPSGFPASSCTDAQYPNTQCSSGFFCQRGNEFYWQCIPGTAGTPQPTSASTPSPTTPATPIATSPSSVKSLGQYAQCGGKGGDCPQYPAGYCVDGPYPASTCPSGTSCIRQNEWYWQCLGSS